MAQRVLNATRMRMQLRFGAVAAAAIAASVAASTRAEAAPAARPKAPQISGEVLDREGAAVVGITVIAQSTARARRYSTVTDARGQFCLDGLPTGSYWFIALDAALPAGSTPALPVSGHLEVVIHLDDEAIRA